NKKDERGIVIRNKARLVAQGHTQEEGIDYEEVFALVARIEAIRLFLAYASFMGFPMYQMDVKSAFLYGTIEQKVYVCQPPGFEDPQNPDKVYKVVKALYGLHQAHRAWYETLPTYLLENGFKRDTIDQTLFIKKQQKDILLVKQKKDGIFISQDKYVAEILKKFRLSEGKSASTAIDAENPLLKDSDSEDVDVHTYRSMIGSLMYLTSSRPDIMFAFWNTAVVKRSGDVTRLQALVDKKRIVITEEVVREILQLNDAEGIICLPNEEFFAGLARMGYEKPSTKLTFYKAFFSTQWKFFIHTILHSLSAKRTSWNEFSSAMASAVICLSSGFSRVETHLFENMIVVRDVAEEAEPHVPAQGNDIQEPTAEEVVTEVVPPTLTPPSPLSHVLDTCSALAHRVEVLENNKAAQQLEIVKLKARVKKLEKINKVKSSKLRRLRKVGTSMRIESSDDMEDENAEVTESEGRYADKQEVVEVVTTAKLITEVATAAASQVSAASTTIPTVSSTIPVTKPSVPTAKPTVVAAYTRRRKGVVIRDPEKEVSLQTLAETLKVKDKGKGLLVETPKPIKKKEQIEMDAEFARKFREMKRRPQTESEIRNNMIIYLKNTAGYKLSFFKGMTYDEIQPIFKARFDANMKFLLKTSEEMEEDDREALKYINETPTQKAAKRRKLAQEAEELKKQLQVVADEDDDVFIDATPLARKVPVMDYQIVMIDNKPRFKIIRADETQQLYDAIWKNQRSVHGLALVKSWKLLASCGVHVITLSTVQLFLLVERKYPLSRFTLEQLVNVKKLQMEEESEMSLELLGFTRQQLKEYQG
nr:hypothetical protein [Tanacetum cinerariifolium]